MVSALQDIVKNWVNYTRLEHVMDHVMADKDSKSWTLQYISIIANAMVEDIKREALREIQCNGEVAKAIRKKCGQMCVDLAIFQELLTIPFR